MSMSAIRPRRWTRDEYERMVEAGILGPEDRVELLDGEILEVTPQRSRHATAMCLVETALRTAFGTGHVVRPQLPVALDDDSEPEPDVAVVRGAPRDYLDAHPRQVLLLVEVAESTLAYDRGRKLRAYARNGVPEYWIVNLTAGRLEVYREPAGEAYASTRVLSAADSVRPLHAPADVPVAEILP